MGLAALVLTVILLNDNIVALSGGGQVNSRAGNDHEPLVPALIVFGDSIMDPGNNNGITTIIKSNFPPYGVNFVGHKPTGRFCDGKIPTDFIVTEGWTLVENRGSSYIVRPTDSTVESKPHGSPQVIIFPPFTIAASKLGIKEYMPAYVGTYLTPEDLITGVSFASAGTGYDPLTAKVASVLSFARQLELFEEYRGKVRAIVGEERAAFIFSESLYVVCAGSDDIANMYFPTPLRKETYDIPSYASLLADNALDFVQELLNLGARRIGVVGIPPIGCVPSQRTLQGGILRSCNPLENMMASLFNSRMDMEMRRLSMTHPRTLLVLADIYGILYDMIQRPASYGFEISTRGCCGTGKLEVSVLCNSLTSSTCSNASTHVFWDSYHPTEQAYRVLVDFLYKKYIHLLI